MIDIPMPRLSDTMEEGTILRWLKQDGEQVSRGEELVEIETDKANMTYESDASGVLQIVAKEGESLPVGVLIARIGEPGELADLAAPAPAAALAAAERQSQEHAEAVGDQQRSALSAASEHDEERVKASPVARRVAHEKGIDLQELSGSGPGGRILKSDVEANAGSSPPIATAKGQTTVVELSRIQQTIARRMAESKATIPHFTLQTSVDMEECVGLREQLKRLSPSEAPTYNDMVVKACALALREHPRANGSYRDARLQLHSRVNVGIAVAVEGDGAGGGALIVPTVFDADIKSLGEIASETRTLAGRVRDGSITPPELGGGTFSVSNLGMYGIESFTAIVNPPQAGIISVGSLAKRAVVYDGEITARNTMSLTLSCDHRILYGADAARFLARVGELLKEPAALTL